MIIGPSVVCVAPKTKLEQLLPARPHGGRGGGGRSRGSMTTAGTTPSRRTLVGRELLKRPPEDSLMTLQFLPCPAPPQSPFRRGPRSRAALLDAIARRGARI